MNRLQGVVASVEASGDIRLVGVCVEEEIFSIVVIESRDDHLTVGQKVFLLFKETEVAIAKDFQGKISLRNQFKGLIESIEKGKILSEISLNYKGNIINSIITTRSVEDLELKKGDRATAFVKTNELMISVD
jgi:molybdate transport system regulatory protein